MFVVYFSIPRIFGFLLSEIIVQTVFCLEENNFYDEFKKYFCHDLKYIKTFARKIKSLYYCYLKIYIKKKGNDLK